MRALVSRCPTALFLCLSALAKGAHAQSATELVTQRFDVDPMHSTVAFASTMMGAVKVRGRFNEYASTLIWDPKHPELSSVSAIIQATSINTDMKFRDDHLRSPDFFDAKQFPTIKFVSERVVPKRGGVTVTGTLTMHGVSRRVTFPAKMLLAPRVTKGNSMATAFSAEFRLSRKDFGIVGDNKFNPDFNPLINMLSDSVGILLEIYATHAGYADLELGAGTPPGVADTVNRVLRARGVAAGIETYRTLRTTQPTSFRFGPDQLDVIGHQLAERGSYHDAVEILKFNAEQFADTPGVLESLGEAQALANDGTGALETYRRAVAKFPESASAREMVRNLERLRPRT
jgi:polyisoprenoid-binding protein YceI